MTESRPGSARLCRRRGRNRARQGGGAGYIGGKGSTPRGAVLTTIEAIRDDFAFLDDWEDRYRYILELGRALEPLPEASHNDATKVRGCVSQVWIESEPRADAEGRAILHFRGDSDSHLVRGLVAIAIALYSDREPAAILAEDARATFTELGLEQHLTPQRSNGVRSMIERIRAEARALAA